MEAILETRFGENEKSSLSPSVHQQDQHEIGSHSILFGRRGIRSHCLDPRPFATRGGEWIHRLGSLPIQLDLILNVG
jgi:hypothetical protein